MKSDEAKQCCTDKESEKLEMCQGDSHASP